MAERERPSSKPKELNYFSHYINFPNELIRKEVDALPEALDALKLGLLADRDRILQQVGNIYIPLSVSDIPPFKKRQHEQMPLIIPIFNLTSDTTRFISSGSNLTPISSLEIQEWYLRALEMQRRFDDDRTRLLIDLPEGKVIVNSKSMDHAWEVFEYPDIQITNINPTITMAPYARIHIPHPKGIILGPATSPIKTVDLPE